MAGGGAMHQATDPARRPVKNDVVKVSFSQQLPGGGRPSPSTHRHGGMIENATGQLARIRAERREACSEGFLARLCSRRHALTRAHRRARRTDSSLRPMIARSPVARRSAGPAGALAVS